MTLEDAIMDDKRPLTIPPVDWMKNGGDVKKIDMGKPILSEKSFDSVYTIEEAVEDINVSIDSMLNNVSLFEQAFSYLINSDIDDVEKDMLLKVNEIINSSIKSKLEEIVVEFNKMSVVESSDIRGVIENAITHGLYLTIDYIKLSGERKTYVIKPCELRDLSNKVILYAEDKHDSVHKVKSFVFENIQQVSMVE